jgi:hypothetical protein
MRHIQENRVKHAAKPYGKTNKESTAIVILMAGKGQRFVDAGYSTGPKWNIVVPEVGKTLLDLSISGLAEALPQAKFFLVGQAKDFAEHSVEAAAPVLKSRIHKTIGLREVLAGPLATLASVWEDISSYRNIFVQVCDTFVPSIDVCMPPANVSLVVYCFKFDRPNLCHVDETGGRVARLREKEGDCVSLSSSGLFWIRDPAGFSAVMRRTLARSAPRDSTEYFISDAVNTLLDCGAAVVSRQLDGAFPLGTPAEVAEAECAFRSTSP